MFETVLQGLKPHYYACLYVAVETATHKTVCAAHIAARIEPRAARL